MKIAVLCHLDYPIANPFPGGLESHTWSLCCQLIQHGHEVVAFCSGDSDPAINICPLVPLSLKAQPVSAEDADAIKRVAYRQALALIRRGGFDLIHNNSLNGLPLQQAASLNMPMITVLHTPPFLSLVEAAAVSGSRFLAVSQLMQKRWSVYVNSQVVYNGIDLSSWQYSPVSPPDTAIWFGRFVPEKAPHEAIAAALRAGFELNLAGPICDRNYFESQILPHLAHPKVHYLGHLSHAELPAVVGQAAVFIKTPQWDEPYGLVYAEALACGTPVATLNRGAAGEILTRDCGRIVEGRETAQLAQAMKEAAQLDRKACRRRAETFCQLEAMVDRYEEIYQGAIAEFSRSKRKLLTPVTSVSSAIYPGLAA